MSRLWLRLLAAVLLVILLQGSCQVLAQAPQKERAFVYGINAALPTGYSGSFAPPLVPSIYLLADQTSMISPRMTEIYFWPITNEYVADWNTLNQVVSGTLEISRNGRLVASVESTKYTIHYTSHGSRTTAELFLAQAAEDAQARFKAEQKRFQKESSDYLKAERAWTAAVEAARIKREAGESVSLPPNPQPPAPINMYSNGLNHGFPIELEAGDYQIQLRSPDGTIVSQSQRSLIIFAPRRIAVGYTVVPETRWTTPEQVNDLSDVILGTAGSTLYLEPHVTREYPARAYELLQNPQTPGAESAEWSWEIGEPTTRGQLEIVAGDQVVDRRPLAPYRAKQVPGSTLGYEIHPFVPGDQAASTVPDFEAYPVRLEQSAAYSIRLVSPQGTIVPGSARQVRVPAPVGFTQLLVLPTVPLILGAWIVTRRRRRLRLPRDAVK
ncbi:MAG TPA: hypothetical protein VGJ87_13270 [Roseiflexaceae bacterium]|jgi:hypothetical protein